MYSKQLFTGLDFKCNWSSKNYTRLLQNKFIVGYRPLHQTTWYTQIFNDLPGAKCPAKLPLCQYPPGSVPKRHVHLLDPHSCHAKPPALYRVKPHNNYGYTATESDPGWKPRKKENHDGVLVQTTASLLVVVDVISSTMVASAFFFFLSVCSSSWQGMPISTRPTPIWHDRGLMSSVCVNKVLPANGAGL